MRIDFTGATCLVTLKFADGCEIRFTPEPDSVVTVEGAAQPFSLDLGSGVVPVFRSIEGGRKGEPE